MKKTIKQFRTDNNITQASLAHMVGYTTRTIKEWEKGGNVPFLVGCWCDNYDEQALRVNWSPKMLKGYAVLQKKGLYIEKRAYREHHNAVPEIKMHNGDIYFWDGTLETWIKK